MQAGGWVGWGPEYKQLGRWSVRIDLARAETCKHMLFARERVAMAELGEWHGIRVLGKKREMQLRSLFLMLVVTFRSKAQLDEILRDLSILFRT